MCFVRIMISLTKWATRIKLKWKIVSIGHVNVNGGIAPKRKKVVKLEIWPSFYDLWHCLLISINSYNAWNFEMCMWGRGFSGGGACVSYIIWAPLHVASAFSIHWLVDWLINCCLTSDVQYFNHVHSEHKFTNNKWITNNYKGWYEYWPKFRWPYVNDTMDSV